MAMLSWSELVAEVLRKSEDVYMYCSTCSTATQCTESLETIAPIEIKTLNSCCACLIQMLIENFTDVPILFIQNISGEDEVVYLLDDVLLDVSESGAVIVPKDRIGEYLESLREFDEEKSERVKQFVESALK
jgi:hypothetical protein|uniref:Uncharacterized protein n=1 Tax=Ignisphaera aggregans TaxID=334771 RepID=A0A7J3Z7E2_9CREN